MKFFIPLNFYREWGGSDPYSHVRSIYGPYKDDRAAEEAIARLWPNNKEIQFLVLDGYITNFKPAKENSENEKRELGINNCA